MSSAVCLFQALVVACGVDYQLAQHFSRGGVDDRDGEVLGEYHHACSGMDIDSAGLIDAVVKDANMRIRGRAVSHRCGVEQARVAGGGCCALRYEAVGSVVVVVDREVIAQLLQILDGGRLRPSGEEPLIHCLLERTLTRHPGQSLSVDLAAISAEVCSV